MGLHGRTKAHLQLEVIKEDQLLWACDFSPFLFHCSLANEESVEI